jgi:glycosyltransferase involved in cell wall biosynthesis
MIDGRIAGVDKIGRIAIVAHSHPSITKGGGEIAAYTLFRGLLDIGADAVFVAACPETDRPRLSLGTSREHVIFFDPQCYDHFYHLGHFETTQQLEDLLTRERISLVNLHHFFNFGLGALRRRTKPLQRTTIITLHEFLAICNHHGQMVTRPSLHLCERASPGACTTCFPEIAHQQFALRKRNFLAALGQCDAYVSPSTFLAGRFVEWGLGADRFSVIENGVQTLQVPMDWPDDKANPPQHREDPEDQPQWIFGFFGQITPFKGADVLLRAATILRKDQALYGNIHLRLHGNLVGQSEEFVTRLKHEVQDDGPLSWVGPYDNSSVAQLMRQCDYIVVASRWWENSPVVIQEAFAAGRPVICSGIGGMAEKVHDGVSGLHFKVNDHFDLVRVLKKAADAKIYGAFRAGLPRPYDRIEMARRYLALFAKVGERLNLTQEDNAEERGENRALTAATVV